MGCFICSDGIVYDVWWYDCVFVMWFGSVDEVMVFYNFGFIMKKCLLVCYMFRFIWSDFICIVYVCVDLDCKCLFYFDCCRVYGFGCVGSIWIDGYDICDLDICSLRKYVVIVF